MAYIMAIILILKQKETKNKTSFPLNNIHDHQVEHMKNAFLQKGIVFLIIRFKLLDEVYLLPFSKFQKYWDRYKNEIKINNS